jgi:hypothetical protein
MPRGYRVVCSNGIFKPERISVWTAKALGSLRRKYLAFSLGHPRNAGYTNYISTRTVHFTVTPHSVLFNYMESL